MADPADFLSEFGLGGKSQEEADALTKARAKELQKQRSWAVLSMLGTPEMQAAGRAQFGEASRQQAALEQMAPSVLNRALAGQHLALERQQLGLEQQRMGLTLAMPLLASMMESESNVALAKTIGSHLGPIGKLIGDIASLPAQARLEAIPRVIEHLRAMTGMPALPGMQPAHPVAPVPATPEAAPAGPVTAPPVAAGVPAAGVGLPTVLTPAQRGKTLHVKHKKTGKPGWMSPEAFDPTKYEKIP